MSCLISDEIQLKKDFVNWITNQERLNRWKMSKRGKRHRGHCENVKHL